MAEMVKTRYAGVYKRGSRYVAVFMADGRQHKESAPTLQAAKALKEARTTDARRGEFHEQTRITLDEYATEWVNRYQGTGRGFRESTRDDYKADVRRYVLRYFGNKRLSQVQPRDVAKFVAWLCDEKEQGQRLADATVRRIVSPLRACLRSAVTEGLIRSNPARDIAFPHREKVEEDEEEQIRVLSRKQVAAFLSLSAPRYRLMFEVLAATGLRISELIALQWRDLKIDQDNPHVKVRRQFYRGRLTPPKSKYGRRDVPIDPKLASKLRKCRMASDWSEDDHLVFPSKSGACLSASNLRRDAVRPIAEKVGAPWATPHTFRHTCASMLFAQGRNVVQVQRWLGHHSPAFTLNTYVHLLPGDAAQPLALDQELKVAMEMATDPTETDRTQEAQTPDIRLVQA
jgi:integrase